MDVRWTEQKDDRLRELWIAGWAAREIAADIGGVSRNAVIGRSHRLNLTSRRKVAVRPKPKPNGRQTGLVQRINAGKPLRQVITGSVHIKATAPAQPLPITPTSDNDIPHSQRCTVLTLTDNTCRWPVGDPSEPAFFFCGHRSADLCAGKLYCRPHMRVAYGQSGQSA
jgi:GcrA cell cycle regulator